MVARAEHTFDSAKRLYQSEDYAGARKDFDEAVDQMLEASDFGPADRQDYQRRFEDMVETVYGLDVAGMGPTPNAQDGKYEKAPLEDILQMTFPVDPKLKNRVREQAAATGEQTRAGRVHQAQAALLVEGEDRHIDFFQHFGEQGVHFQRLQPGAVKLFLAMERKVDQPRQAQLLQVVGHGGSA